MGNRKETHSALNLANFNPEQAGRAFNVEVEHTIRELNGEPCKVWDECRADNQQIFSTQSVGQRITTLEELKQALTFHVATVASLTNDMTKITAAVSDTQRQIDLFSEPDNPALMQTLDTLNTKFGRDAVFLWRKGLLRIFPRVKLSPQYTTRLKALPKSRC